MHLGISVALGAMLGLVGCVGATQGKNGSHADAPDAGSGSSGSGSMTMTDERIVGVTIADTAPLATIVESLRGLPRYPTARIVFDENVSAADYVTPVREIGAVSDVMGEILDSVYVPQLSTAAYLARTQEYLTTLGPDVDIWEIGNEINGEWVDDNAGGTAEVVAKMSGAFDLVRAAGGKTALTLYGCSDTAPAYDMLTWAAANVPARMKTGLDYVLVSFYEGDCGVEPPDWQATFSALRALFPTAKLGFGEVGAVDLNGNPITNVSAAAAYLQRYYQLPINVPGYIGGHFWWYFVEDMLPLPSTMYTALCNAIQ